MRSHTSTTVASLAVVLVGLVSATAPATATAGAARSGHVAQAIERPPATSVSRSSGPRFITSYDGCCVKVRGVDGGRFLKGM
jgi:hypothetical protein